MDQFQLRTFFYTAEFASLSKASLFLKVSQPTVSRNIRKLEEHLNTTLLIRHGRGVALTDDGVRFLEHAKIILDQMEDATRDLISLKREPEGVVNLGHPPSVGTVILPDIVGRVIKKFPKISLVIHESGSTELYEWLVDGRLDVALIHDPEPSKNMIAEELLVENVYVVGTDANELSKNESISLEELSKLPLILPDQDRYPRKALEDGLAVRGLALNSVVEVNSAHIMRCLALQGFGYAILPLSFVLEDVEAGRLNAIRIDSPDVVQSLSTVTTTFHPVSAATRAVAHMIKKEFLILAKTKYSESVTIA